jgi:hypothetical protein
MRLAQTLLLDYKVIKILELRSFGSFNQRLQLSISSGLHKHKIHIRVYNKLARDDQLLVHLLMTLAAFGYYNGSWN